MSQPEDQPRPREAEDFYRSALLLLAEIRDYTRRTCEAVEQALGRQADDPRHKPTDLYRNRG